MTSKKEIDSAAAKNEGVAVSKKRERIVKKDTDRVYSASQDQGERYDSVQDERAHKRAAVAMAKDEKAAAIHALESEVLVPPRKNRGRPSKAYIEAQKAYEDALQRQKASIDAARAALAGDVSGESDNNDDSDKIIDVVVENDAPNSEIIEEEVKSVAQAQPSSSFDDEVPEFVRMQQMAQSQQTAEEVPTSDVIEPTSDAPAEKVANALPAETTPVVHDIIINGRSLSQAYAEGQYFIIIDDVPVIDSEGFVLTLPPADEGTNVGFRRYKDDAVSAATLPSRDAERHQPQAPVAKTEPALPRVGDIIIETEGVVEIDAQGAGYLRSSDYNYMPSPDDVFISQNQIRHYALKTGDSLICKVRAPKDGEKYYTLSDVLSINDCSPQLVRDRIAFEHLTPLFPDEQFRLSKKGSKAPLSCRIVDLFAPIGKGQRALIVAQPKTGKTILMKQIANAIAASSPETYLMMLLIDERPEEVTDMARTVNAEVIASTFDEPAKRHVRIANIVLEKAKRMVECGRDVVIFLDSITRLARAFNTEAPASGKILTGGVDANALQKPKRFFGAARNIEGGGSLTIIATALIDTGSKMDEVIFEEFKGTGNMELVLDRNLANKRIFPAVNLVQSSTRREDLLLDELTINRMHITRNFMTDMSPVEAMAFLRKHLEPTISNEEFIATISN